MVVRTGVMRGLSISDAFSSSGRNRINMGSDAASLSASWQSPVGFYAGGRTSYVRSSSNISAKGFAVARDNEGVGASVKAGYRFAVPLGGMDFCAHRRCSCSGLVWTLMISSVLQGGE